jgi:hypothetical protein
VPEASEPSSPESATGHRIEFKNLTGDFARELVADLSGLADELAKERVTQLDFLNFCIDHLTKIDNYVEGVVH